MEILTHPTAFATGYFLASLVIGSFIQWSFLSRLKKYHDIQWKHAGSPTMVNNSNFFESWTTTHYLLKHRYLESNNRDGIDFCRDRRTQMLVGYFISVTSVPVFFASLFIFGWPPGWQ